MNELNQQNRKTGQDTIFFGGSGFLGHHILENYPEIISVGRTSPQTRNRHIQLNTLANLDALGDLSFDKVIFIIENSDRINMRKSIFLEVNKRLSIII